MKAMHRSQASSSERRWETTSLPDEESREALQQEAVTGQAKENRNGTRRSITVRSLVVTGGLSKETVAKVLQERLNDLRVVCQESEPSAELTLKLTIAASGQVKSVSIIRKDEKGKKAEERIVEQIKRWQFPAAGDGMETSVNIVIVVGV